MGYYTDAFPLSLPENDPDVVISSVIPPLESERSTYGKFTFHLWKVRALQLVRGRLSEEEYT